MVAVIFAIAVCCAPGCALVIGPFVMKKNMYLVSDHGDYTFYGNNAAGAHTWAALSKD